MFAIRRPYTGWVPISARRRDPRLPGDPQLGPGTQLHGWVEKHDRVALLGPADGDRLTVERHHRLGLRAAARPVAPDRAQQERAIDDPQHGLALPGPALAPGGPQH